MTPYSQQRCSSDQPDNKRLIALAAMHLGCLGVLWTGWSWTAIALAFLLYVVRAFGLTAFYHRYFSHRAFRTSRWFQFIGASLGTLAMQKGPLWWAAHHREHHRSSDHEGDVHSPHVYSFLWAHMGWFLTPDNNRTRSELVKDWMRFPELRLLDQFAPVVAILYGSSLYLLGQILAERLPQLNTNGAMLFVWGFFLSTVLLYHATYSVNSFAHLFGTRRFATKDQSRNNAFVALLTLGEGWHNNHHQYPASARQGFFWWEVDATYYILLMLQALGLVWGLKAVPRRLLEPQAAVNASESVSESTRS